MFAEVKAMLPISGDAYDQEIIMQIKAAALDLTRTAEIVLPGSIEISRNAETGAIVDESTLNDELAITAIATWCTMRIGNPPNYDNLLKAYESMKGSMRISSHYTAYGEVTTE
jgi:hypothetical protein